jgi:hypothetical protein
MPHGRVLCMALTLLVLAARVAAGAFAEQYTLTDIGRDFMRGGFCHGDRCGPAGGDGDWLV